MASSVDSQGLPGGNSLSPTLNDIDGFIELIPAVYYGINKVFEDSTAPTFTKKEGLLLWALYGSRNRDAAGTYLSIAELVATFRDWFVVSERSAGPEVSKAKSSLIDEDYIMVAGGGDHIHLTQKGEAAIREIRAKAKEIMSATLKNLSAEDRERLLDIAGRLIRTQRLPPQRETQQRFDFSPAISA